MLLVPVLVVKTFSSCCAMSDYFIF
jgi:hypothetical protein